MAYGDDMSVLALASAGTKARQIQQLIDTVTAARRGQLEDSSDFNLSRGLRALADNKPLHAGDARPAQEAAKREGRIPSGDLLVPWSVLHQRAMGTQPGAKGGYLSGVSVGPAQQALAPWSTVLRSGCTVLENLAEGVQIPRVSTAPTGAWQGGDGASQSANDPVLGSVSLTQKTYIAVTSVSLQLLKQGADAEQFLSTMLLRVGGRALDAAVLAGAGGAEPLGLSNNPAITSQSGTSLSWATTLGVFKTLHNAGVDPARITAVVSPSAAETLAQREKVSTAGRFILDDAKIGTAPAFVSPDLGSAASAIVGDFSYCVVGLFGSGLRVDVHPTHAFSSGGAAMRVMLVVDTAVLQPAAFVRISSIT